MGDARSGVPGCVRKRPQATCRFWELCKAIKHVAGLGSFCSIGTRGGDVGSRFLRRELVAEA